MPTRPRSWPFTPRSPAQPFPVNSDALVRVVARFAGGAHLRAGQTTDGSVAYISRIDREAEGTIVTFEAQDFVGRLARSSEPLLLGRLSVAPARASTRDGVATLTLGLQVRTWTLARVPLKPLQVPLDWEPDVPGGEPVLLAEDRICWSTLLPLGPDPAAVEPPEGAEWRSATLIVTLPGTPHFPSVQAAIGVRVLRRSITPVDTAVPPRGSDRTGLIVRRKP